MFVYSNNDYDTPQPYTLRDVVEGLGYDLGLADYPIWSEDYRPHLNKAITDHFWLRRIASDTPQKFVFYLNRYMRENMPAVNAIYSKINSDSFDPFTTAERLDTGENAGQSNSQNETAAENVSIATASKTPQAYLTDPQNPKYMDSLAKTDGNSAGKSSDTSESESSYNSHVRETAGGYAALSLDILDSGFLNTDQLVFEFLEPLFLQFTSDFPM